VESSGKDRWNDSEKEAGEFKSKLVGVPHRAFVLRLSSGQYCRSGRFASRTGASGGGVREKSNLKLRIRNLQLWGRRDTSVSAGASFTEGSDGVIAELLPFEALLNPPVQIGDAISNQFFAGPKEGRSFGSYRRTGGRITDNSLRGAFLKRMFLRPDEADNTGPLVRIVLLTRRPVSMGRSEESA
jgi:hypothetical protein